jgi:hypothetical protein
MDTLGDIIKYLLTFIGAVTVLMIIVLAILWKMSPTRPWRLVVAAFARRLAATWGIALIDIPATALQPLGDVWDIGTLIFSRGIGLRSPGRCNCACSVGYDR